MVQKLNKIINITLLAVNIVLSCHAFSPGSRPLAAALRKPSAPAHLTSLRISTEQIDDYTTSTANKSSFPINPSATQPSQRRIAKTEKFARLPVWPVWQGVFLFFASKIVGQEVAAEWEDKIGGRVCPNFLEPTSTAPFVLLVHHRHGKHVDSLILLQHIFYSSHDLIFHNNITLNMQQHL